ncbi:hypothetical protein FACS1894177_05080 [Bacteroidia bacterium]|nr:hypothetical protein FACS1894177_05080 [Bacteroidia bacterium]
MARELILNNPYRTLGLLAGASAREITRQTNNLKKYIAAGAEPPSDYSFATLGRFRRTAEDIDAATAKLNLDEDKMLSALFWFWNGNEITDEPAFDALKEGDAETAYQIWNKRIIQTTEDGKRIWKAVSGGNFSAFHNYFVVETLRKNGNRNTAVAANLLFLESAYYLKLVNAATDTTYKTTKKDLQLLFLNEITEEIESEKVHHELLNFVKHIKNYDFAAKTDFLKFISQKFTTNITAQIEIARKARTANKQKAATAGENLFKNIKNDFVQLKEIFGAKDFSYSNIADKVANELLQCSIDFFNDSQDKQLDNDYQAKATTLAKLAQNVAVGQVVKGRIKENLQTLENMKDREILQAIAALQSVKDAYETNKTKITARVKIQELTLDWNQSINWNKVNESIENSIDWNKVVELIQKVITSKNVDKIKNAANAAKIDEYKRLVDFVFEKLSRSQKSKVSYLDWWGSNTRSMTTRTFQTTQTLQTPLASIYTPKKESWSDEAVGCLAVSIVIAVIVALALIAIFNS